MPESSMWIRPSASRFSRWSRSRGSKSSRCRGSGSPKARRSRVLALLGAGAFEDLDGAFADGRGDRHRAPPRPRVRLGQACEQAVFAHRVHQVVQEPQIALAQAGGGG